MWNVSEGVEKTFNAELRNWVTGIDWCPYESLLQLDESGYRFFNDHGSFSMGKKNFVLLLQICKLRRCDVVHPRRWTLCYLLCRRHRVSMMSPSVLLSVNETQSGARSSTKPICRTHMRSKGDLWTVRHSLGASSSSVQSDSLNSTLQTKWKKPKYGNRIYCLQIYYMLRAWAPRRHVAEVQESCVIELAARPLKWNKWRSAKIPMEEYSPKVSAMRQ